MKNTTKADIAVLLLRLGFGLAMLPHGINKLDLFSNGFSSVRFADPIGIGSGATLILTLFAEILCSVLIVLGIRVKEATIPLMITMLVAIFIVHGGDPWAKKEMATLFLTGYLGIFFLGSGKYALRKLG
ncbi:MAG: putative oxidoreductase [Flavobacteriales bacterium]|jgi:putative oxidoreductase